MELSYAFDVSDQKVLAGFSDRIFVGRVTKQVGRTALTKGIPAGQFDVQVLKTLKGPAVSHQIVNQEGGPEEGTDNTVLVEGDPILVPGRRYLFAGRMNATGTQLSLVAVYGTIDLDRPSGASSTSSPDDLDVDPRVVRMQRSIKAQKAVPRLPSGSSASRS